MQFTKHFTGVTAVLYFVAMLPGTLQKPVDKGSYDDKFIWCSSKWVYSSLIFIAHVIGFQYFVM